jgi:hypothetical protein
MACLSTSAIVVKIIHSVWRGPPKPTLLRYVGSGTLGSVRRVILEREKGARLEAT